VLGDLTSNNQNKAEIITYYNQQLPEKRAYKRKINELSDKNNTLDGFIVPDVEPNPFTLKKNKNSINNEEEEEATLLLVDIKEDKKQLLVEEKSVEVKEEEATLLLDIIEEEKKQLLVEEKYSSLGKEELNIVTSTADFSNSSIINNDHTAEEINCNKMTVDDPELLVDDEDDDDDPIPLIVDEKSNFTEINIIISKKNNLIKNMKIKHKQIISEKDKEIKRLKDLLKLKEN
jgi:hypothetical protein